MMCAYTLRLPFRLAPGRELTELDEPVVIEVGSKQYRLSKDGDGLIVRINGFATPEEGAAFIDLVWRGLSWVLIEQGIGFHVDLVQRDVRLSDQPFSGERLRFVGELHGIGDADGASVVPSDRRVAFVRAGPVHVRQPRPASQFLSHLIDGMHRPVGSGIGDDRVTTALDLLSAHYFERTHRAQFLTLVTALEVLTTPKDKGAEANRLLDRWQSELEAEMEALDPKSTGWASLESLGRELLFRRKASIRGSVRALPREILGADDARVPEITSKAVAAYDARSILVHEGTLPEDELEKALENGREVLRVLLTALLTA
jgi:hypothetical protein